VISPQEAAQRILAGIDGGGFLILTHTQVARFEAARVADRDAWLGSMRQARGAFGASLGVAAD
jgi:hypothetical protein